MRNNRPTPDSRPTPLPLPAREGSNYSQGDGFQAEKHSTPLPHREGQGGGSLWQGEGLLIGAICIAAPLLCFGLDQLSQHLWNYHFGYELLMLNGLLTFCGLWAVDHLRKQ